MKKVLLVIAGDRFQSREYQDTKKQIEAAGIKVVTISDAEHEALDHKGNPVPVDFTISKVHPREYDGLFLIGGPGAPEHLNIPELHKLLAEFFALGKPYGAICISPRILAHIDLLKGKKATSWDGDGNAKTFFEERGVQFVDEPVVIDGVVVTANGPEASVNFGKAIVELIQGN